MLYILKRGKRHLHSLQNILKPYEYKFYIFGSRINGRAKTLSDIDLFYRENIPKRIITLIEEAFEESDFPYKVNLIDYNACDNTFQKIMDFHNKLLPRIVKEHN